MPFDRQLPYYQCHKKVWALKIAAIEFYKDGSALIAPKDDGYAPFDVKIDWKTRWKGTEEDLGYWVQYEDGFESWSPTKTFEDGYTKI